jgi:hypothetical protein
LDAGALRCIPPQVCELLKMGHICAPENQFPMDLDQTKVAGSSYGVFLRFYQRVEALGATLGRWCTEMYSHPVGELLKMGQICVPWTEFPMDLDQTKVTGFIYDTFLRYYQVAGALGPRVSR